MGKTKRIGVVAAVTAAMAALGAAPAQANEWVPCDTPAIGPLCDAAARQVENAKILAEEATDYVVYWGDQAIVLVNGVYYTVTCDVLGECG